MKKFKLFKMLAVLIVLITSINTAWAGAESLNEGNMKYTFNGGDVVTYGYNKNDYGHVTVALGELTGSFVIKSVSFQFSDDWKTHGANVPFLYMVYSYDDWTNRSNWNAGSYDYDWSKYWVYKDPWNYTIATNESGSGTYTLNYYWELNWQNGTKQEINNNSETYEFTYYIMPPSVSSFSVSEDNHAHGDGSSGNPYVLPYGSNLSLTINGNKQHTDANSSAQYYNTSSADDWSATSTKTIPSVTSTTATSVTVKMRYHNGTASLDGAESSETIWYKSDYNYTVNVGVAEGSTGLGTVSTSSVNVGNYASQTITATPNSHYLFDGWECTGGAVVEDASNSTTKVTATSDGAVKAKFAPVWAIRGGDNYDPDGDDDKMGDWSVYHGLAYTGETNIYRGTIKDLEANTTYLFKVVDRPNNYHFGFGETANYDMAFVGQSGTGILYNNSGNDHNVILMTAGAGDYTFEWNSSAHTLKVIFPDVTHPTVDYVYFDDDADWNGKQEGVVVHLTGGIGTGSNSMPYAGSCTISDHTYYFAAYGNNTTVQFNGKKDVSTYTTGDKTISTNEGKYYDQGTSAWTSFTFTITLDEQAVTTSAPDDPEVEFNGTALSNSDGAVSVPVRTGYIFGGYWNTAACTDKMVISSTGAWQGDKAGFTDSDRKWIHEGGTATLYAKWTPKTTTVSFNQTDGTGGQTSSVTATYDAAMPTPITTPTRDGYAFAGYWDGTGGTGTQYYNADGTSTRNWDKEDATCTLHAKWTEVALTFDNGGGDNDWYNKDNWDPACVPTSKHNVTITANVTVEDDEEERIAYANTVTISSGILTIEPSGTLIVTGGITNGVADRLVIEASDDSQGALIFNSDGSTYANVELVMQYADPTEKHFQMVAIPISYVDVSSAFADKGAYTYTWSNTNHEWVRRGYYEGFSQFEPVLVYGKGYTSFSGALVSTGNINYTGLSISGKNDNGDVYMYGNSWTAPIERSKIICENATISLFDGSANNWEGAVISDYIPALQGFAVVVKTGETGSVGINYTNAVRNASSLNESLKAPQRYTDTDPKPIAIYVSGNEMRTRIRLFEDETRFTNDLDDGWEAYYMEGEGLAGEMYAIGPERKMNVLATPNLEGTVVGFVPGQATDYTISFTGDGKGYYLNDIATGESTLIDEANTYNFKSDEDTNATRFVVSKMPLMPTGVDEVADGSKARKQMIDGTLYIIRDGRIYKVDGALVK